MINNWAGTISCQPQRILYPRSIDEVCTFIQTIGPIKVMNHLPHSPNDIWCTNHTAICLHYMNRIESIDTNQCTITVQGGTTLDSIIRVCAGHTLTMAALPSIKTMSIGGAISTGCHGTGVRYGGLSSKVQQLRIVNANGTLVQCSEHENESLFRAALCSLGALGIIVEVTLKVEPRFAIVERFTWSDNRAVDIEALGRADDFVKLYFYPHADQLLTISGTKVVGTPAVAAESVDVPWWKPLETWVFSFMLLLVSCATACRLIGWWTRNMYKATPSIEELSSPILHVSQLTAEWAIPIGKANAVWQGLRQLLAKHPDYPAHFVEIRFVAGTSRELISPVSCDEKDALFCYVGMITYTPFGRRLAKHRELLDAFEGLCLSYQGRPHWAKEHHLDASQLCGLFGQQRWDAFSQARSTMDTDGKFLNSHLHRVFGIV